MKGEDNFWSGEEDKEGRRIGAECNGTTLKLEQPCDEKFNDQWEGCSPGYSGY